MALGQRGGAGGEASGSVHVTNGGVNPVLTIVANALRIASLAVGAPGVGALTLRALADNGSGSPAEFPVAGRVRTP